MAAKKKSKKTPASKALGADDPVMVRAAALTKRRKGIEQKRMFGGVAFMVNGHMAFGGGSKHLGGRLMVRVGPDAYEDALAEPHTSVMDFTGRVMKGFVIVEPEGIADDQALKAWIDRGIRFARSLPPK